MAAQRDRHLVLVRRLVRARPYEMHKERRRAENWIDDRGHTCNYYARICGGTPRFDVKSLSYPLPCCSNRMVPRSHLWMFRRFLSNCTGLERLQLQTTELAPSLLTAACARLAHLEIRAVSYEDPRLEIRHLPSSLKILCVRGVHLTPSSSDPLAHVMERCPNLRELHVHDGDNSCRLHLVVQDDRGRMSIKFGRKWWRSNWYADHPVVSLSLYDEKCSVNLTHLSQLMTPRLTTLHLDRLYPSSERVLFETLRRCSGLKDLTLSFKGQQSLAFDELVRVCPRLRTLSVSCCHVYLLNPLRDAVHPRDVSPRDVVSSRDVVSPRNVSLKELQFAHCVIIGFEDLMARSEDLSRLVMVHTSIDVVTPRFPRDLNCLMWGRDDAFRALDFDSVLHENIKTVYLLGGATVRRHVEEYVNRVSGTFDCDVEYEPRFKLSRKLKNN